CDFDDVLGRLLLDPGQRTIGQLIQDRQAAVNEIVRLREELERIKHSSPRQPRRHLSVSQTRELVALTEVCRMLRLSRSTIYKRLQDGTFPKPVRIGARTVRWSVDAIAEWCVQNTR